MTPNTMETGEGSRTRKRHLYHCKRCREQHFWLFHVCDEHEIQYGLYIEALTSSVSRDNISLSSINLSQV